MEELSKIAMGYYQACSDELRKLAHDFFEAMDTDEDGKIDKKEFLEFMRDAGYAQMTNTSFFNQLDRDNNGTLDFAEVMTLYYIIKSGRPFCDCCNTFITSTFFSCVGCLEDPIVGSFYLCLDCYITHKHVHTHNDVSRFLDNYALLEAMKNQLNLNKVRSPETETRSRPAFGTVPVENSSSGTYNHTWNPSSAMIPCRPTPIQNDHLWSPTAPLQNAGPVRHNQTWIQNNYSFHNNQPPQHVSVASNAIVPQRNHWMIALGALNAVTTIWRVYYLFSFFFSVP